MGWSPTGPEVGGSLAPSRPALRELRGGFVRVCRTGCDLRCDGASAGRGLADFIAKIAVAEAVAARGKTSDEREEDEDERDQARGGEGNEGCKIVTVGCRE